MKVIINNFFILFYIELPIRNYLKILSDSVIIIPTLFKIKNKLDNARDITCNAIKVINLL